jgi:hypothetical protein
VEVHERRLLTLRELATRALIAVVAGLVAGVLDLWVYEFSLRGFFAGLAAGVSYFLIVLLFWMRGMERFPLFLFGYAIVAGAIGGTAWWLVCRGSALWVAIAVGSVLALAHFASQGFFASRR